jgi:hypothetical protein
MPCHTPLFISLLLFHYFIIITPLLLLLMPLFSLFSLSLFFHATLFSHTLFHYAGDAITPHYAMPPMPFHDISAIIIADDITPLLLFHYAIIDVSYDDIAFFFHYFSCRYYFSTHAMPHYCRCLVFSCAAHSHTFTGMEYSLCMFLDIGLCS